MALETLKIEDIEVRKEMQPRMQPDEDAIAQYKMAMQLPTGWNWAHSQDPMVVFRLSNKMKSGKKYLLAEGFHRE